MTTNAKSLGILPLFFFFGFSSDTAFPVPTEYLYPTAESLNDEKYLLRAPKYEAKRQSRWAGLTPYAERLTSFKTSLPNVMDALTALNQAQTEETLSQFRTVFLQKVIK